MLARDQTRAGISTASSNVRPTPLKKYKLLRNKVTASIRYDSNFTHLLTY